MSKMIGLTILILLAGALAIAWSLPPTREVAPAAGIFPHEMHVKLNAAGLPVTQIDDRSLESVQ